MADPNSARWVVISAILVLWVAGCGLAASQGNPSEVLDLMPLGTVVLVPIPGDVVATLEPVGELAVGQTVPIVSCTPRKSHTEVQVMFHGAAAVVWKGPYRVLRRNAVDLDPTGTSTCTGLGTADRLG